MFISSFQIQVGAYACIGSLFNMVLMIVFGSFLMILAKFSFGRWLILKVSQAHSVTCLATDASLTADPGVASSIPARSHTFVEIDHEIISMDILFPSAESFKKGCCQLQAKVCAGTTG